MVTRFLEEKENIINNRFSELRDLSVSLDHLQMHLFPVEVSIIGRVSESSPHSTRFDSITHHIVDKIRIRSYFPGSQFNSDYNIRLGMYYQVQRGEPIEYQEISIQRLKEAGHYRQYEENGAICVEISSLSQFVTDELRRSGANNRFYICQQVANPNGDTIPNNDRYYINSVLLRTTDFISFFNPTAFLAVRSTESINDYRTYRDRLSRSAHTLAEFHNLVMNRTNL